MSAPRCRITVNGREVSGTFMSRIVSCEVVDAEGLTSDTFSCELNDWPLAEIPQPGAEIRVWLGYSGQPLADMGTFTLEETEVTMLPFTMRLTGKAADTSRASTGKQHRERHWDGRTVGDVVRQVAGELGLEPRVSGAAADVRLAYLAQQGEGDIAFIERLADRYDALFSIKAGRLVFVDRAEGTNAQGEALTSITVTPRILIEGSATVRFADRAAYGEVRAEYTDRDRGERVVVTEEGDPEGSAAYRLPEQYADEEEARAAARAKARQLRRSGASFSCTVIGDPAARAGAPLAFAVGRPGVDGLRFTVGTARHSFSKAGYTTDLDGELAGGR